MALGLKGIVRRGKPFHPDFRCLQLKGLLGFRGGHKGTLCNDRSAHVQSAYLLKVIKAVVINDLQRTEKGAVTHN